MIDWGFIGELEGRSLTGYVPDPESSKSGVTIATGCDLGWLTPRALAKLPQPFRFSPYVGMFGPTAADFVRAHPITIIASDADAIDRVTFADDMELIVASYGRDAGVAFITIPNRAQTVIASVGFQYGNLRRRCPRFWSIACKRDWAVVVHELLNFGDAYPTRRHREADYLGPLLTDQEC